MSRSICPTRAESGSSRCASRSCPSNSPRKPRSRRRQRSGSPPITAESTISFSHFHGALSAPATTISSSPFTRSAVGPLSSSSSGCASTRAKPVTASSAGMAGSGARAASSPSGTCPRDRYSANRMAERRSTAQASMRQERPAAGMRPASAALEPARDAGAIEGVFEQTDVVGRAAQHHGHAIEANPGARLLHDPAGNFDALAAFAGRREHLYLARRHALGRLPAGEQVAAERREVGCGRRARAPPA